MSKVIFLVLAVVLLAPGVYAGESAVTPFGASCPPCDTYGYCGRQLTYTEAVQNLEAYYAQKGLKVSIVRQFGRFVEANIYRNGAVVEKIIVDRRTGRIRPIR
jgi:heterodisulfide reductase subunit C